MVAKDKPVDLEDRLDAAVRFVMARGWVPQGYLGRIETDRETVRAWFKAGAPVNGWWFPFMANVLAVYRAQRRQGM